MTAHTMERMLKAELESLNKVIDRRIYLGLSYEREAREHRIVLARLMRLKRAGSSSFTRFSFASNLFK